MNKCLVTKLNGSVSNSEILRLGEMRVHFDKVSDPTEGTQKLGIGISDSVTMEIIGDGFFTDKYLTVNKGKTFNFQKGLNGVWVSNNDLDVAILNKYKVTYVGAYLPDDSYETIYKKNKKMNINDLKYSLGITQILLPSTQSSGDIGSLKDLTELISIDLSNTEVSGDISALKNLLNLKRLFFDNTKVSGNIKDLNALTKLTGLSISNVQNPLTGNIGTFSAFPLITDIILKYSKLTGDLATLPASCKFVSFLNDKGSSFTWGTRASSSNIIAIEGDAYLTDVDKMLQDQAQCQVGFSSSDPTWYKAISVKGNRTSASDDAVAILQQKGYTINIIKR